MASSDTFDAFSDEVMNIRTAWELWELLAQVPPEGIGSQVGSLASHAPTYYRYSVWSLLVTVVLGVCRLTDPKVDNQGNKNLSIELIWDENATEPLDAQLKRAKHAMDKANEVINEPEFRKLRNRIIAHNDLDTITGKSNVNLSTEKIEHAVGWLARFRERIAAAREGLGTDHRTGKGSLPPPGDVAECRKEILLILSRMRENN